MLCSSTDKAISAYSTNTLRGLLCRFPCSGNAEQKNRASEDAGAGFALSVLAWQVDYVVGKVQCDFIQRKIGVLDLLGEHDVAVAIVARKRSGSVGT